MTDRSVFAPTWAELSKVSHDVAVLARRRFQFADVWGVPRGGCVPAVLVAIASGAPLTEHVGRRTLIIDDIVESGSTRQRFAENAFIAFYRKSFSPPDVLAARLVNHDAWVTFPWEANDTPAADALLRLWQADGIDTTELAARAAEILPVALDRVRTLAGPPGGP